MRKSKPKLFKYAFFEEQLCSLFNQLVKKNKPHSIYSRTHLLQVKEYGGGKNTTILFSGFRISSLVLQACIVPFSTFFCFSKNAWGEVYVRIINYRQPDFSFHLFFRYQKTAFDFEKHKHRNTAETWYTSSLCILIEVCFQVKTEAEIISTNTVTSSNQFQPKTYSYRRHLSCLLVVSRLQHVESTAQTVALLLACRPQIILNSHLWHTNTT